MSDPKVFRGTTPLRRGNSIRLEAKPELAGRVSRTTADAREPVEQHLPVMPALRVLRAGNTLDCDLELACDEARCATPDWTEPEICADRLSRLPDELLFMLFRLLSPLELSRLAITSKHLRDKVFFYTIGSNCGYRHLFPGHAFDPQRGMLFDEQASAVEVFQRFANAGIFLKRLTILASTFRRLQHFARLLRLLQLRAELKHCDRENFQQFKFRFRCIGQLVHRFIRGWDETEAKKMLTMLEHLYDLPAMFQRVRRVELGAHKLTEYYVRYFYRMVFFDSHQRSGEKAFWIGLVLDQYSVSNHELLRMMERSKWLILFFGPLIGHQGEVSIVGWEAINSITFVEDELSLLGNAIEILSKYDPYRGLNTCMLLQALLGFPTRWRVENQASLLFHAGLPVAQQYMQYLLKKEDIEQVNLLLIYVSILASRRQQSWCIEIIDHLHRNDTNFFGNLKFMLSELPETFFRAAIHKEELALDEDDIDDDDAIDMFDFIKALADIMRTLLRRNFNYEVI